MSLRLRNYNSGEKDGGNREYLTREQQQNDTQLIDVPEFPKRKSLHRKYTNVRDDMSISELRYEINVDTNTN